MTQDQIAPYVRAGFACHWLHPRTKRPYEDKWTDLPVATFDALQATYRAGDNVGVRPGEPSQVDGGYLHILDVDIRVPDLAGEAMERLREMFPDVDSFPSVISGSGGASRHFYIISDKPFRSRLLAASESKFGRFDKARGKTVWSNEWEIELFGSGKQVVMPPSIHPDTGNPYVWERPFDFDLLDLGFGPFVAAEDIEALGVTEDTVYAFELVEPLTFAPGQMERDLSVIDVSALHYDDWIRLGQAIHHQTGGSAEGFDLWLEHTKRSTKFTGDKQIREMRRSKWRSFGKYRKPPVTMATIRQWAQDARSAVMMAELDDLTDDDLDDDAEGVCESAGTSDFDDILGGDDTPLSASDEFDLADSKAPKDEVAGLEWKSLLEVTEEGGIKGTLHNIRLIVESDPRFAGLAQYNEFTQEVCQRTQPGAKASRRRNPVKPTLQLGGRVWEVQDTLNGDLWSSARDYSVRSIIEAPKTQGGYSLKVTDRDLKAATILAAWKNAFHPVREYLGGLVWDGIARIDQLFICHLGAPDDVYHRNVARLMLIAGVTRIFEPGHKFDSAIILEGPQGIGKSSFIRTLAKHWPGELEGDFHEPKQLVEKMQGAFLLEMPELSGFARSDVQAIKAFISRPTDRVRLAYEARASNFPRQSLLIGSTNDREYLKDATGGRRFLPIACADRPVDVPQLSLTIDQLWAEATHSYRLMRKAQPSGALPLYLTDPAAAAIAARLQESRRVETPEDALAGQIAVWLEKAVRSGSIDDDVNGSVRMETCLAQIWRECFDSELPRYNSVEAQKLGKAMRLVRGWCNDGKYTTFPSPYGRQRRYFRIATSGDEDRALH